MRIAVVIRALFGAAVLLGTSAGVIAQTLPSPWVHQDIGNPAVDGTATYSAGTFTIDAAGKDIWGATDQFHFVYQPVSGDVDMIARVASITREHVSSKAGVMIRESLTIDSKHAMMVASAAKGYAFQRRPNTGAVNVSTAGWATEPPGWVRLVRTGDTFEAYQSSDGTTWVSVGTDTIPMGETVYVGLATNSHDATTATRAVVDNVKVIRTTATNNPPAVSIISPTSNAQYNAPASFAISVTASDPEGQMLSVDFYVDQTMVLRDTSAPYSATWSTFTPATYSLTAVAHDADGGSTTSSPVTITVNGSNPLPTVSLTSPSAGATFTAPATISLAATATDPENQLARVEFLSGTTVLGTDTTAPYTFSWGNVAAGIYTFTARAHDSAGAVATSAAVTVTVGTTTTSPPRLVVFTASSDHATNVASYLFEVFAAGANPATAQAVASSDLGKPTPDANNDITVDRSALFSALATGSYVSTVSAIGPGGTTRSAAVTFTR